jgi:HD-GYP domain-containing protein (c-di-GMP phosphodiesterase class II)
MTDLRTALAEDGTEQTRDPGHLLRSLAGLKAACALYPEGHPSIDGHVEQAYGQARELIGDGPGVEIDVLRGVINVDGEAHQQASRIYRRVIDELATVGIDSIHMDARVTPGEFRALGEFLARQDSELSRSESVATQLASTGVHNISLGRILPVDSYVPGQEWPEAPERIFDDDYRESVDKAKDAFEHFGHGFAPDVTEIQDLLDVIVGRAAHSKVALSQVLALKSYENLTYLHSVNVTLLSLRLGERIGLDERTRMALAEAALLHDVGKTRIPLEILTKPGALTDREFREIRDHPRMGAEIIIGLSGLTPLSPIVALEHHIGFDGTGYPDLGAERRPHPLSQIVSVVDIYESLTGARSYREPVTPDKACLTLARLAGEALNPALVRAFVSAVTFFPVGTVVRTTLGELGVVVRTFEDDALHPTIALVSEDRPDARDGDTVDLRLQADDGSHIRQVAESLPADDFQFDIPRILLSATG